jgi:hypothetical protein
VRRAVRLLIETGDHPHYVTTHAFLDDPEVRALLFGLAHVGSALPSLDFVDAVSPGGEVVDTNVLARQIAQAAADGDLSAGAFGSRWR